MVSIRELDESIFDGYKRLRLRALKEEPTAFTSSWKEEIGKSEHEWKERMQSSLARMFCAVRDEYVLGMSGCRFEAKDKKRHKATVICSVCRARISRQGAGAEAYKDVIDGCF